MHRPDNGPVAGLDVDILDRHLLLTLALVLIQGFLMPGVKCQEFNAVPVDQLFDNISLKLIVGSARDAFQLF